MRNRVYAAALLRAEAVQLFGNFGGSRVDGQQAFQLLDRQLGLARLGVDLRQVLGGRAVALVELQRAPQLGDGRAARARVGGRLPEQRPPERRPEIRLVRDETRRLAQRLDRLVVAARLQVLEADVVKSARAAALDGERCRRALRRRRAASSSAGAAGRGALPRLAPSSVARQLGDVAPCACAGSRSVRCASASRSKISCAALRSSSGDSR